MKKAIIFAMIGAVIFSENLFSQNTEMWLADSLYTESSEPVFMNNLLSNFDWLTENHASPFDKVAIKGYATFNEGFVSYDEHRKLNNVSVAYYRANSALNKVVAKYPEWSNRIYIKSVSVDSNFRGICLRLEKDPNADQIQTNRKAVHSLATIAESQHKQIGWFAEYLLRQAEYGWELGLDQEYILIERNEFSVPMLLLTWNAGLLGFQGKIGGWSADQIDDQKTYNGIWGGSFFLRPWKHLKLHAGYQGISRFYESDLTWQDRYDCFLTGVELESPEWKQTKAHLHMSGIKADKWGMSCGIGISFKL